MRALLGAALLTAGLTAAPRLGHAAAASTAEVEAVQDAFRGIASSVKPAVVSIASTFELEEMEHPLFFGDPEEFFRHFFEFEEEHARPRARPRVRRRPITGVGSGVIIDPRGYVLTNEHVVGGAKEIKVIVKAPEEKTYKGKVVGTDPMTDLAVVKIKADGDLPHAVLGDSDRTQVGDWVVAIGSPFALEQTVTVGVLSAIRQSFKIEDRTFTNFLQTDAAINQGNSGGPLVNIKGEVIGVNTAVFSPTGVFGGVGFAIPANQAQSVMNTLIEKGRVVRGWAGVEVAPLNKALTRRFRVPEGRGALVNRVLDGSPADKAGLRRGDVIVEFDGKPAAKPEDLTKLVADTPPGKRVPLRFIRSGAEQQATLEVGERPAKIEKDESEARPPERLGSEKSWEGAQLRAADEDFKRRFDVPKEASGAAVVAVEPGSLAAEIGLRPGDLIVDLNGHEVRDAASFLQAARRAKLEEGLVLDVIRRGQRLYLSYQQSPE